MNATFLWRTPKNSHDGGQYLLVNDVMMGSFMWCRSIHDSDKPYRVTCKLPGVDVSYHATAAEARSALEQRVRKWFEGFGV